MGKKKTNKKPNAKQSPPSQRVMGWTLVVILLVCVGAIFYKAASGPQTGQVVNDEVFEYDQQPALGSNDAPVKMVGFADFKCPSCKAFDEEILPLIKKDFIDNGTVQYYFVNYPIISPNGDSTTAALAAEAIYNQNPEEFWKFHDAVFTNQKDERQSWATPEYLIQVAQEAKLAIDFDLLKKDIEEKTYADQVKLDTSIGNKAGIRGTPTIFINGKELSIHETFDYEAIKSAILQAKDNTP
ncbi:thioredoxin domain-containing protein [Ammoniphilus sp. CFH 90114]|uniref:DsbA family protein n=1 Tax=Ammoniphilus sp. CFH 90114 TaxID=2493665 RepID=UPI0013E93637|nr:thioredoxin domain-containing protein [Ammoniphilus sp. CFH 90114]